MKPIPWKELAEMIHANNVEKGWWDEPRTWRRCRALIGSELVGEALEEFRASAKEPIRMGVWFEAARGNKPEGFPVELADGAIRILDWLEHHGRDVGVLMLPSMIEGDVPELLDQAIESLYSDDGYEGRQDDADQCRWCLGDILKICEIHGIDLEAMIRLKHAYNVTRPRMHGGKKC